MPPHFHFVTTLPSKTHTTAHIAMLHFHNICNIWVPESQSGYLRFSTFREKRVWSFWSFQASSAIHFLGYIYDYVMIRCVNRCSLRLYYKNYVIFAINREKWQSHFWPSAFLTGTPAIALSLLYFFPRCCWLRARYVYYVIYAPDRAIARARQGYVEGVAPLCAVHSAKQVYLR